MRHVVLVVILVGAAFLGGAFINGPGMRWVQTQVLGSLGLGDEGEVATVDLSGAGGVGAGSGNRRPGDAKAAAPIAPMPTVVADGEEPRSGSARGASSRRARAGREESRTASRKDSLRDSAGTSGDRAEGVARAEDGPPPLPADLEIDRKPPRVLRDPAVTLATAAPDPVPAPADGRVPSGGEGPSALADSSGSGAPSLPEGLRPAAPDSSPAPLSPRPRPAPGRSEDADWATLARKMQVLGISRFTIEGQPGGRVVFACLIPMAGRHAVSQRFEAEGEDAVAAARAALRRVALWRAAQPRQDTSTAAASVSASSNASSSLRLGSSSAPAIPDSTTASRPSPH